MTAFLYCASTAYTHGYFQMLSLDSDVLGRDFHQILYHGMILNLWPIIFSPLMIAIFVTIKSGIVIEVERSLKKGFASGRVIRNLKKWTGQKTRKLTPLEKLHVNKIYNYWLFFIAVMAFFLAMVYFERQGNKSINDAIKSINSGNYPVIIPRKDGERIKLAYLYCGVRNCAGFNVESKEVVYFPQEGHSYIHEIKNVTSQSSSPAKDAGRMH